MKRVIFMAVLAMLLAGCGSDEDLSPVIITATPVDTPTITETPTATPTITLTKTITPTPTVTWTPAATPTLGAGANIDFFGILRADNTLVPPTSVDDEGRFVFERPNGSGFLIVVEARRGTDNRPVGETTFNAEGPPDFQIEADRNLGNGSSVVCDTMPPDRGGVPGIDPPDFSDDPAIIDALNDFGCRFLDGTGQPRGRNASEACVLFPDGEYRFVNPNSTIQFCGTVTLPMLFAGGDTVLTARVLNVQGTPGPEQQIVVRVP